jgi:hypothetical protein
MPDKMLRNKTDGVNGDKPSATISDRQALIAGLNPEAEALDKISAAGGGSRDRQGTGSGTDVFEIKRHVTWKP